MNSEPKLLECVHCNWVHFGVTRAFAESEIERFNLFFNTLSEADQNNLYGGHKARIRTYEHCNFCGLKSNMRVATAELNGQTIGPIIFE